MPFRFCERAPRSGRVCVCVCPHLSLRFRVTKDATKGPPVSLLKAPSIAISVQLVNFLTCTKRAKKKQGDEDPLVCLI